MSWCDASAAPCGSCYFGAVGTVVLLAILFCAPAAYFILGRKFDRLVGQGAGPEFWLGPLGRLLVRPLIFAMLIVANPDWERIARRKGKDRVENHPAEFFVRDYRGIDYRSQAGLGKTVFSWIYVVSSSAMVLMGLALLFCEKTS